MTEKSLQIKIDTIEKVWSNEILKSFELDKSISARTPLKIFQNGLFQRKISFPSKPKINKTNFKSCLTSPKIEGSSYYDVNINDIFL